MTSAGDSKELAAGSGARHGSKLSDKKIKRPKDVMSIYDSIRSDGRTISDNTGKVINHHQSIFGCSANEDIVVVDHAN